jgi:hypothetical protein
MRLDSKKSFIKFHKWREKIFSLTGLGCTIGFIIFGIIIKGKSFNFDTIPEIHGSLLIELGIASFIIVILGLTLDKYQKEKQDEMLEQFKENSFFALFGWILPNSEVFLDTVTKQIFHSNFIRKDWIICYTLNKISDNIKASIDSTCNYSDSLIIEIDSSYKITNIKSYEQNYNVKFWLEKEDAPTFNRVIYFNIQGKNFTGIGKNEEELRKCLVSKNEDISNEYNLGSYLIQPGETVSIRTKSLAIRSINQTTEFYTSVYLSESLTITIKDQTCSNLSFVCEANSPHRCNKVNEFSSNDCREITWSITEPLLPYQGIYLKWHKPVQELTRQLS